MLDVFALPTNTGAHHLAAAHAGGPIYNLEARAVLEDDVTDTELKWEDELLGLRTIGSLSFPGHWPIVA